MFSLLRRQPARADRGLARAAMNPLVNLRDEMEGLFGRFFDGWDLPAAWTETRDWTINETDQEVVMRLELPGFEAKEIELRREGDMLTVRAEHTEVVQAKEEARQVQRFEHRFTLPVGIDAARIEATYRNGVLELHLPRRPEAQPKRIEVKT
jgi:HSP20 family protein